MTTTRSRRHSDLPIRPSGSTDTMAMVRATTPAATTATVMATTLMVLAMAMELTADKHGADMTGQDKLTGGIKTTRMATPMVAMEDGVMAITTESTLTTGATTATRASDAKSPTMWPGGDPLSKTMATTVWSATRCTNAPWITGCPRSTSIRPTSTATSGSLTTFGRTGGTRLTIKTRLRTAPTREIPLQEVVDLPKLL